MSKMADAAAARREARRRKILENSHNRLQLLTGKSSDEFPRESPVRTVVAEPEYEIPAPVSISSHSSTSHQNGVIFNPPPELLEYLSTTTTHDASGDSDLAPLWPPTPPITTPEPVTTPTLSLWDKITTHKYDIVLLTLFLQILYSLSLATFDNGYIFLPILVYIVTKLIWFPTQTSPNLANMLLANTVLNGMSPARVQKILYLSQCSWVISRDIFVYLFVTICIQALWITLKESLVT